MVKHYIIMSIRNLFRNKVSFLINTLGLSIGLACCIIITLYVHFELSYDSMHEKKDRIFRVVYEDFDEPGVKSGKKFSWTPAPLADELREEIPAIQQTCRIFHFGSPIFSHRDTKLRASQMAYVDSTFFDFFSFDFLEGHHEDVLKHPFSLAISESFAQKLFGDLSLSSVIGKRITMNAGYSYEIKGIYKDMPDNTQFKEDVYASFITLKETRGPGVLTNASNWNYVTFFMIHPGASIQSVNMGLANVVEKQWADEEGEPEWMYYPQKLTDIYLSTEMERDFIQHGNPALVIAFSTIALFILLIACINYVNLLLAQQNKRMKEFAIRKVLGGTRKNIVIQNMIESLFILLLSFGIALCVVELSLPYIADKLGVPLEISQLLNPVNLLGIGLFFIVSLILTGYLPSVKISKTSPLQLFRPKGQTSGGIGGKKALIVFQFIVCFTLISSALVVYLQIQHMKDKDLGFKADQLMLVDWNHKLGKHYDGFYAELMKDPSVVAISKSNQLPSRSSSIQSFYYWNDSLNLQEDIELRGVCSDPYYVKTLGLQLTQGRDFLPHSSSDSTGSYIINESAARYMNMENPVGKDLRVWSREKGKIIGVVKDFHFQSPKESIKPIAIYIRPEWAHHIAIRVKGNVQDVADKTERLWKEYSPQFPFGYELLNESFNRVYLTEERQMILFSLFAGLTIFIACLGLLGLVSFMVQQKTKEIGVRKVLGGSVLSIFQLLAKQYSLLLAVGMVISWPLTYYLMNYWLGEFEYRISMPFGVFVVSAVFISVVAFLSVGFHTIKAARMNPVWALRYE